MYVGRSNGSWRVNLSQLLSVTLSGQGRVAMFEEFDAVLCIWQKRNFHSQLLISLVTHWIKSSTTIIREKQIREAFGLYKVVI